MRVRRLETFIADLTQAYDYLTEQSPKAANRLLDRVELIIALLGQFPESGRKRPRLGRSIRSHPVRGFRYLIFYKVEADEVALLRLWHSARRISRKRLSAE